MIADIIIAGLLLGGASAGTQQPNAPVTIPQSVAATTWCTGQLVTIDRPGYTMYACVLPPAFTEIPAPSSTVVTPDGHVLVRGVVSAP